MASGDISRKFDNIYDLTACVKYSLFATLYSQTLKQWKVAIEVVNSLSIWFVGYNQQMKPRNEVVETKIIYLLDVYGWHCVDFWMLLNGYLIDHSGQVYYKKKQKMNKIFNKMYNTHK